MEQVSYEENVGKENVGHLEDRRQEYRETLQKIEVTKAKTKRI